MFAALLTDFIRCNCYIPVFNLKKFIQICTRVPNSITALSGKRKNSTTPPALRVIAANKRSRQGVIPPPGVETIDSRLKK